VTRRPPPVPGRPSGLPGAAAPPAEASAGPPVYQFRVWLRGVSPMVWRRLLVRGDATLADLHETLQVALGWTGEHLHRFRLHGREFAVPRDGADLFDDARRVPLTRFGLRVRERFLYEYDFTDGWQHEVRVEAILPLAPRRTYPVCLAGARAAPPEECGGPWAYLRLRPWLQRRALATLIAFGEALLDAHRDGRPPAAGARVAPGGVAPG
jgi:hypothetical protein